MTDFNRQIATIHNLEIAGFSIPVQMDVYWPNPANPNPVSNSTNPINIDDIRIPQAAGGPVHPFPAAAGAGAYWVGEVGPELFVPNESGRILSNSDSMALATYSSGGGTADLVTSAKNTTVPIRELQQSTEELQQSTEELQQSIDDVTESAKNLVFPFREMAEMYNNTILNGRFDMSLYSDKTTMGRFDMSLYSDDPVGRLKNTTKAFEYRKPIDYSGMTAEEIRNNFVFGQNEKNTNSLYSTFNPSWWDEATQSINSSGQPIPIDFTNNTTNVPPTVNVTINTPINMSDETWVERTLSPYITRAIREATR
jgi:hypothetical protein